MYHAAVQAAWYRGGATGRNALEGHMRLAKLIYTVAGCYGIVVVLPGLFAGPGSVTPLFYYAFLASALVWQLAFLVIAVDPGRFRWLMPVTVLEKAAFFVPCLVLYRAGTIPADATFYGGMVDGVLMCLFAVAWWRSGVARTALTRSSGRVALD
jgi:hypothetical protein